VKASIAVSRTALQPFKDSSLVSLLIGTFFGMYNGKKDKPRKALP
jgi:hypothetical protein